MQNTYTNMYNNNNKNMQNTTLNPPPPRLKSFS